MPEPGFKPKQPGLQPEQQERKEWGRNVALTLKIMRHGDRDKQKNLSEYGRKETRQRAKDLGIKPDDFDAIKAIGSSAGPEREIEVNGKKVSMGRALETAHIYADELDSENEFVTRVNDLLNFETIKTPAPHDHTAVYNSNLPENYDDLDEVAKAKAAEDAQIATVNYVFSLHNPEAEAWKREQAGAFAYLVEHYQKLVKKLKNNSRVLIPAGSHGPTIEILLQQALVIKKEDGTEQVGFDNIDDIGGPSQPSDSYNIEIVTDENGEFQDLVVTFDDPDRPQFEMRLDGDRIRELAEFYEELHPVERYNPGG